MSLSRTRRAAVTFALLCAAALAARAQQQTETVRVFTEEVLLPVRVTDERGRFDPTLERGELLVLEDGVAQEVTGARRLPASVLVLVATGGELNPAMKTSAAREATAGLVARLRAGDRVSVMQYGAGVETVQGWTEDTAAAARAVKTGLSSLRGARLAAALAAAAAGLEESPAGNRHLVLITDGVDETADGGEAIKGAVARVLSTGAAVHVVGYTRMGGRAIAKAAPPVVVSGRKPRKTANDIAAEIMNPVKAESQAGKPNLYLTIDLDVKMRRRRAAYERAMREGEQWLGGLSEETGGALALPLKQEELAEACARVAREIGSHYVVAYRPKRPLASAAAGEYRRVEVFARRVGLVVSARRGYVVTPSARP